MPEGTTENTATSSGPAASSAAGSGNVTSGTASAAMLRAVEASSASSAPAAKAGDTTAAAAPKPGEGSAAATTQTTATGDKKDGPVPLDVHTKALANAREKAIAEFAWAKGLNPQVVRQALGLLNRLRTDPKAYWNELGKRINAGAAEEKEETIPEADIQGEGGVKAFSDKAMLKALEVTRNQVQKAILKELSPVIDFYNSERDHRAEEGRQRELTTLKDSVLSEARQAPHFKENEVAIAEKMKELAEANPELVQTPDGAIRVLYRAYNAVLAEKVFPTISTTAEQKVRDENRKKAAASEGSVHPSGQQAEGNKPNLRNADDLARHMERLEKQLSGATA